MERILNDEEKIRKAEEIYFRRNNKNYSTLNKKQEKKTKIIKDKIVLNLLIMFNLAIIVCCVQNKEFIFTKEFIDKLNTYNSTATEEIISIFNNFINEEEKMESNISDKFKNKTKEELSKEEKQKSENIVENSNQLNEAINKENISISSINEMELDIRNLKAAYKFIKPIEGIVSSGFGTRESEYQNVRGYHTGLDIAAEKGTDIIASMQGIVDLVSSEGDYGKHLKIRCNNVTTLYAHCSEIFVKEGQIVAEGQKIASVGSTGNSTGPHLHFEIRIDNRFVDPARVISF